MTQPRQLDIYKLISLRHRDALARRLSVSDRAFVRAQIYLRAKPPANERSELKLVVGKFLLGFACFATFTYTILRFLTYFFQ